MYLKSGNPALMGVGNITRSGSRIWALTSSSTPQSLAAFLKGVESLKKKPSPGGLLWSGHLQKRAGHITRLACRGEHSVKWCAHSEHDLVHWQHSCVSVERWQKFIVPTKILPDICPFSLPSSCWQKSRSALSCLCASGYTHLFLSLRLKCCCKEERKYFCFRDFNPECNFSSFLPGVHLAHSLRLWQIF